jgi:chlorobactene glucosyltransferase
MSQTLLIGISTAGMLIGLFIAWKLHTSHQMEIAVSPEDRAALPVAPFISVIVPARNEARNIRRCVEALLEQNYPQYELIVVDDRSSDATPRILAELAAQEAAEGRNRLHILHGKELTPGWAGKPHTLVQGAAAAQGEWLCFIDADTFATPHLLSATMATALKLQADLFTMLTDQELGSFWEKAILPLVFTALAFGFPAKRVNDPTKPDAIANGQFILIRREVYEATGGHTAVKERIDEDKALAETVKRGGYRLVFADGRQAATTRMYTRFSEMWEGWTKNIYLGLRDRLGLLTFGAFLGLVAALLLPIWLAGGLTWLALGGGWAAGVLALEAAILWAYLLILRLQACREFHISPLYALTLPLGALVFTAMMFASAWKVLSGRGVTWKGRTYSE